MWQFISQRWTDIAYSGFQHVSLVVQAVVIAAIIAIAIAVLVVSRPRLAPVANGISAVGLTIPSFALLGLLLPLVGIGTLPSVVAVAFYAALPILRNAVVGFQGVDRTLLESATGVLALGGGAPMQEPIGAALVGRPVVFLDVGIADAAARIGLDTSRPLLAVAPRATWIAMMKQRRPTYERLARWQVDTAGCSPEEVVEEILAARTASAPGGMP